MRKRIPTILTLLLILGGLAMSSSCDKNTGEENAKEQEQRFFDIYMASNYPDAVLQPSGIFFLENKAGSGAVPGDSSWLIIEHVGYTIPENQVYETYLENVALDVRSIYDTAALYGPYKVRNDKVNEGFTEGLKLMREGGEATFMFTSDLGFGSNSSRVGGYSSLKYEVRLLEVIEDIIGYEEEKILAYTDTIAGVQTILDTIDNVNMYVVIDKSTDGAPVDADSTVEVAYKGYLIDGRVFDESAEGSGLTFTVDDETSGIIIGWDLGLKAFKEGEKGRMIIPYQLAYGPDGEFTSRGNTSIPPYETLVFDIEVLSVEADADEFHEEEE